MVAAAAVSFLVMGYWCENNEARPVPRLLESQEFVAPSGAPKRIRSSGSKHSKHRGSASAGAGPAQSTPRASGRECTQCTQCTRRIGQQYCLATPSQVLSTKFLASEEPRLHSSTCIWLRNLFRGKPRNFPGFFSFFKNLEGILKYYSDELLKNNDQLFREPTNFSQSFVRSVPWKKETFNQNFKKWSWEKLCESNFYMTSLENCSWKLVFFSNKEKNITFFLKKVLI